MITYCCQFNIELHFLSEYYHDMQQLLVNLFLLSKGNVTLGTSCISRSNAFITRASFIVIFSFCLFLIELFIWQNRIDPRANARPTRTLEENCGFNACNLIFQLNFHLEKYSDILNILVQDRKSNFTAYWFPTQPFLGLQG